MSSLIDIEYLFKEHYKKLYRVALRVVNDSQAADDVVQDVFLSVWKNRETIQINTTIEGYLTKSTLNKALNYLDKNKKNLKVSISDNLEFKEALSSLKEDSFDYELFQQLVYKVLDTLPPKCKTIFMLSRFEDMKYKEIATHLDISIKTVENQMSIALSRLNSELKPKLKNYFPELFSIIFLIFFEIL